MTDKLRDAAQQALGALEAALSDDKPYIVQSKKAITTIRAALAQQESQQKHKPLFAEMIAQHPGLAEELAQQDAQTNHCPTCKRTDGDMCDWCPSMQQDAQAVLRQQDLKILMNRLENQAHRAGELWERCQGKSWPEKESAEFAALRDVKMPQIRAALAARLNAATTPPAQRVYLTVEEIGEAALSAGCDPDCDDGALVVRLAHTVIEAYEKKNGISRG